MKYLFSLLAIVSIITFSSCSKEEMAETKPPCEIPEGDLQLRPFCSFAPATSPDVQFPIAVWYLGDPVNVQGFEFEWSNGVTSSAISVSYNQLPVTVLVKDIETGCERELTLDATFWG